MKGLKRVERGLWEIRISRVNPKTGQKKDIKRIFRGSQKQAENRRNDLVTEFQNDELKMVSPKLRDYSTLWLKARLGTLKKSAADKYARDLDNHILPELGEFYIDKITRSDIETFLNTQTVKKKLAGNTALNQLRLLRTIAKDSVAEGYADKDWCARVKPPKVSEYTEDNPNLLTAPELADFLNATPSQWYPLVLLMVTTGIRWGEATGLTWSDLSPSKGEIKIKRNNWRGNIQMPKTKGSYRTVPMLPAVAEQLEKQREMVPDDVDWVFPVTKGPRAGKLHEHHPLSSVVNKACAKAKVTRITPHGLRRTFNNLARQHTSDQVLKSITGHTTDAMTSHYSLVSNEEKMVASAKILELTSGEASIKKPSVSFREHLVEFGVEDLCEECSIKLQKYLKLKG